MRRTKHVASPLSRTSSPQCRGFRSKRGSSKTKSLFERVRVDCLHLEVHVRVRAAWLYECGGGRASRGEIRSIIKTA